tara:strand:- start:380 stop:586 length:207 start_codon:yes stop_codon:yes gene_type:complete
MFAGAYAPAYSFVVMKEQPIIKYLEASQPALLVVCRSSQRVRATIYKASATKNFMIASSFISRPVMLF